MARLPVPLAPRWVRYAAVAAVAAVVFYFSVVTTGPKPPEPGPLWDKKTHFAGYATLALTLAYATVDAHERPTRRLLVVVGGAVAYGVLMEVFQAPLAGRYFSYLDMLANAVGALLVVAWFPLERRVRYRPVADLVHASILDRV
jgi:VanZ family protein